MTDEKSSSLSARENKKQRLGHKHKTFPSETHTEHIVSVTEVVDGKNIISGHIVRIAKSSAVG